MRTVTLPSGEPVPVLGQGTWHMGERADARAEEVRALRLGLDLGMTLIDTAEMYGEGGSEEVVGEAIEGRRDEVFLVTKAYPWHASRKTLPAACERSLERLGTDRIDLYLLHWPGSVPLDETVDTFERLRGAGKIRHWGVSNFDVDDMQDLAALQGGERCATNQVLYNLARRSIEWDLLPWCRARNMPLMAYSPLDQGRLEGFRQLADLSARIHTTRSQLALAWMLRQEGVIAIPKAVRPEHVRDNRAALDLELDDATLAELDRLFPPPTGPSRLTIL